MKVNIITTGFLCVMTIGVYAGSMGETCISENVITPCASKAWEFGIQALYLKPTYSGNSGYFIDNEFPSQISYDNVPKNWGWGFAVDGSYAFNTGNDINLHWVHYNIKTKPDTQYITLLSQYFFANTNRFDQVDLVLGQKVFLSPRSYVRLSGGLQYADITVNQQHNYTAPFNFIGRVNSDYNGVGPRIGTDLGYQLGAGFGLTANAAATILYGTSRINTTATTPENTLVFRSQYGTNKLLAPGFEEKLGINYNHLFQQGNLTLEGGYSAYNYFGVVTQTFGNAVSFSNFGLYGPYFGLKWNGSI